jgi:two-component system, OmpR family, sensor kinase
MFKSIQWTLQIWHASLLAAVLIGFGAAIYFGTSRTRYQAVDAELERNVQLLAAALRQPPTHDDLNQHGHGGPFGFSSTPPFEHQDGFPQDQGVGGGPDGGPSHGQDQGPDRGPDHGPDQMQDGTGGGGRPHFIGHGPPRLSDLQIPAALQQRAESGEPDALYFIVWGKNDEVIKKSSSVPAELETAPPPRQSPGFEAVEVPVVRERNDLREAYTYGPFLTRLLVGRSIVRERAEQHNLALLLATSGAGVLVIGLAGGWFLSARAVRPIQAIASAAQEISASNLSRRIDVDDAKSELGTLARVLNDMFARLDGAFQQQVRFTADASHELRTPLSVIHTHSQLALSRDRSAEEYRQTIATCLRASNRMKSLVDSLLILAGADAGRLSLNRQPVNLRDLAEESIAMVGSLAVEKHVSIESSLLDASLFADGPRMVQVITNLLTNAIRYNVDGGKVNVTTGNDGRHATITIADTGSGIPPEHGSHLFERFYRVDVARSRDAGGSGLGLAICKTIVDAHEGTISFVSEVGKGTTFTVGLVAAGTVGC